MADVLCPKCKEPWELDSIHDRVKELNPEKPWYVNEKPDPFRGSDSFNATEGKWYSQAIYGPLFDKAYSEFKRIGCEFFGVKCYNPSQNPELDAIYEIMGDDVDGAINFIEDFRL